MGVVSILLECRAYGVTVAAHGGRLSVAPAAAAPPKLQAAIRANAPALLRLLSRRDRTGDLQEICGSCDALYVDVRGFGRCSRCHYTHQAALRDSEDG